MTIVTTYLKWPLEIRANEYAFCALLCCMSHVGSLLADAGHVCDACEKKHIHLCSDDERKSYGVGTTRE